MSKSNLIVAKHYADDDSVMSFTIEDCEREYTFAVVPNHDDESYVLALTFAAAPELLALLTEVVSELSDTDDEGLIEHTDWMMKARAVIAKATGQEAQDQLPF